MAAAAQIKKESTQLWDVKKAGERLLWRFSKNEKGMYKNFIPNENDAMALKSVLAWVNRQSKENVNNNQLFAKLYIHFLTQGIRYHGATVFNKEVSKELHRILDYPLAAFYKAFARDLYSNQFNKITEVPAEEMNAVLKDVNRFKETYPEELIENKLDEAISECLNRFS